MQRTSALPSAAVYSTGSVIGVSHHYGQSNYRLNEVCSLSKSSDKLRRLRRSDLVAGLDSLIEQHALDLVEDESRRNESMQAEKHIRKT